MTSQFSTPCSHDPTTRLLLRETATWIARTKQNITKYFRPRAPTSTSEGTGGTREPQRTFTRTRYNKAKRAQCRLLYLEQRRDTRTEITYDNTRITMMNFSAKFLALLFALVMSLVLGVDAGAFSRRAVGPKTATSNRNSKRVAAAPQMQMQHSYFPQVPCVGCDCGDYGQKTKVASRSPVPQKASGYRLEASLFAPEAAPTPERKLAFKRF